MPYEIHPNLRDCPICNSSGGIVIENGYIWCENCSANFIDPKWARSAEENHEVTFNGFEDQDVVAEILKGLTR